jgi:hypothetical protein
VDWQAKMRRRRVVQLTVKSLLVRSEFQQQQQSNQDKHLRTQHYSVEIAETLERLDLQQRSWFEKNFRQQQRQVAYNYRMMSSDTGAVAHAAAGGRGRREERRLLGRLDFRQH